MDGFAPRSNAAIDYWFWKFHVEDLAFLVDVIIRRGGDGYAETRVSQWQGGVGRVIHATSPAWDEAPGRVVAGDTDLRPGQCAGAAEDVSWELRWSDGGVVVSPLPGPIVRAGTFDSSILVWPFARFDGCVQVGDRRYDVRDVPGTFYHYGGRRLLERWVWISATSFEGEPDRRLEAVVGGRSRLFGRLPYPIPLSFLWTTDGRRSDLTVSTINGLIRTRPAPGGIAIDAARLGGPRHRVVATWGDAGANDVGEGILQTMLGDVTVDGVRAVSGTTGVEMRAWPAMGHQSAGS
jgi:hypothetical protein